MRFVPLCGFILSRRRGVQLRYTVETVLDVPVVIGNPTDIVHYSMAGRSHWGNIFPVFQLDPGLQYFSLLSKSVWHQQEPHGGSIYHYYARIFPKNLRSRTIFKTKLGM